MRINGGLLYNNARNCATKNFNMKGKSIITQLNKEYDDPQHKHIKKLIALEDLLALWKRTEGKKSIDDRTAASEKKWNTAVADLEYVTGIRRQCGVDTSVFVSPAAMEDMNKMWHQYRVQ